LTKSYLTKIKCRVPMELVKRKATLPIDLILPDVIRSLEHNPNLVIEAPPGAGKTTRVPPALLGQLQGEIVVLEPRRIAARLAARRVAFEMSEPVGQTIGYQVRFEGMGGPRTRLRYVTEGVLTRRLMSNPDLRGVDAVVLDEFHERHLDSDLVLALLKRLQQTRPDLRIVVMSATLDGGQVAEYLHGCPIVRSEGRSFDLTMDYLPYAPEPLHAQVKSAVELIVRDDHAGHILVFLPGTAEIRQAMRHCEEIAQQAGLLILPLHGDLSPAEQDRAVSPSSRRKLILATNVAESSVTVDGVTAVVDSGLARSASYSPWTALPTLHVSRISKASAAQRAGRAGRTGPGRVLRLYPEQDYHQRPDHDTPEIVRSDLSQLGLTLRAANIAHFKDIDWLTDPPASAMQSAEVLLDRLGATGEAAKELVRYPLPPRLARILLESLARGVGEQGCVAAALLGAGLRTAGESNDLLAAIEAEDDPRLRQHIQQLRRIARPPRQPRRYDDNAVLISVLAGFPDRVARRKANNQVTLSTGVSAELTGEPPAYEFMVAVDAEDRKDKPLPLIRMTSRIEVEWLVDLFPTRVREQSDAVWNQATQRVEAVSALFYDELVIQESRSAAPDPQAAAELLARKALEAGIESFVDPGELAHFMARVEFAGVDRPDVAQALRSLCTGLRSFAELKTATKDMIPMLERSLNGQRLREIAPTHIRLHGGRRTRIHYEPGKPPWIASRLQDFFGMRDTPRVGVAQSPVVIHLLAPNQRPVQTTTDLAGFWKRLYPQVRRELMRRYPKHAWPENP
jgi:ATP-dependent helicase HrpB